MKWTKFHRIPIIGNEVDHLPVYESNPSIDCRLKPIQMKYRRNLYYKIPTDTGKSLILLINDLAHHHLNKIFVPHFTTSFVIQLIYKFFSLRIVDISIRNKGFTKCIYFNHSRPLTIFKYFKG